MRLNATRQKINQKLDKLQFMMENNEHIRDRALAYNLSLSISKFWSVLSEEDREYVQCAQDAIEEGREWNV
jgi:hypothetical protein